ncbi:hypothetical protein ACGFJT_19350 [Actinomadura geliboluensis]|uniref:hypothetical protein n=1 Tax=Actinomadura geliboluensis TaxID=882440 RepID=UPI00371E474E
MLISLTLLRGRRSGIPAGDTPPQASPWTSHGIGVGAAAMAQLLIAWGFVVEDDVDLLDVARRLPTPTAPG